MYTFPTHLFIETTQIWGKEFLDSMFSMMPGNSSFFVFSSPTTKTRFAILGPPSQSIYQLVKYAVTYGHATSVIQRLSNIDHH